MSDVSPLWAGALDKWQLFLGHLEVLVKALWIWKHIGISCAWNGYFQIDCFFLLVFPRVVTGYVEYFIQ